MAKIENKVQYEWALKRVEELLPLVDDNTPLDYCQTWLRIIPKNILQWELHRLQNVLIKKP